MALMGAVEQQAVEGRITELDAQLAAVAAELDDRGDELRRARVGIRALSDTGIRRNPGALAALEAAVMQARERRQALAEERATLARAIVHGLPQENPHAHLRHRALPNVNPARTRTRVLRIWSGISASILLAGLALVILGHFGALVPAVGGLAVVMLCAEAFARGQLVRFVAGLIVLAVAAAAVWLATLAALGHWRWAIAIVLIVAAAALLLASIRDLFTKR